MSPEHHKTIERLLYLPFLRGDRNNKIVKFVCASVCVSSEYSLKLSKSHNKIIRERNERIQEPFVCYGLFRIINSQLMYLYIQMLDVLGANEMRSFRLFCRNDTHILFEVLYSIQSRRDCIVLFRLD